MSQNYVSFLVSHKSADQSGMVTTTGGNPNGNEALNLSSGSHKSHISCISSILPKDVINSVIAEEDDPLIKNMIDEEFKNEEKEKEKCELEIKREEAKEKASVLWKKMKAIEEQKAAEERMKEQRMREEEQARWKHEEDKRRVSKEYEVKLKQLLREKYIKDMEKEKQRLEMQIPALCILLMETNLPSLHIKSSLLQELHHLDSWLK